ncbi:hypothetical protein D3C75_1079620 [compost metagenome]
MAERVVRVSVAISPTPIVSAGRMSDWKDSSPPEGSQCRFREKTIISSRPNQKLGMDNPIIAATPLRLSCMEPRRVAE